jgi:diguanylate cyclase (GGDEF)-like protein
MYQQRRHFIIMNISNIAIIQIIAGALIIVISLIISARPGNKYVRTNQTRWLFPFALMFLFVYFGLTILSIEKIAPPETLSGSFALACSSLLLVMASSHKSLTRRLTREISEHKFTRDKVEELSLTDQLTGLYNRRGFYSLSENHLDRIRRQKTKAILLYAKLNNLKTINKLCGYQDGDMFLKKAGELLSSSLRQSDIIARIGDDEFIALLVDADRDSMEEINNKFQTNLKEYNDKKSPRTRLSLSFAVSGFDPSFNNSIDNMIIQASEGVNPHKERQNVNSQATIERNAFSKKRSNNFTLVVSNMSNSNQPVDIKVLIDGKIAVSDSFHVGMQNTWKPFHFSLAKGKHKIQAQSAKGDATLTEEFEITDEHWASIEYYKDSVADSVSEPVSRKFAFYIHDVPMHISNPL